eukprot:TRINITY_DN3129_c0_g1_i1.p1 TRINITY_DN3129_c0_g1~~TRINITY_DN3129_c0_g1_i1.p1  ORF type:complete len:441 (+),score=26.25 TRINITY_DN3129_c0_g1_i1:170-1324(+)
MAVTLQATASKNTGSKRAQKEVLPSNMPLPFGPASRGRKILPKATYRYYSTSTSASAVKLRKQIKLIAPQQPFKIQHGGNGGNKGNNRYRNLSYEGDNDDDNNNNNHSNQDFGGDLLRACVRVFQRLLPKHLRCFVGCVALWSSSILFADVLAQLLCCRLHKFDISRLIKITQYCSMVRGPAIYALSLLLGRLYVPAFVPGVSIRKKYALNYIQRTLVRNMFIDLVPQLGFLCGCYSFFFPIVEGKGVKEGQKGVREQLVPSLCNAYKFWPMVYAVRYTIVGQRYVTMYLYGADFVYALMNSTKALGSSNILRRNVQKQEQNDRCQFTFANVVNGGELVGKEIYVNYDYGELYSDSITKGSYSYNYSQWGHDQKGAQLAHLCCF